MSEQGEYGLACFKCEKPMQCAGNLGDMDAKEARNLAWGMPSYGVMMSGGSGYGSALYDSLVDGIKVALVVCDDCITKHKALTREYHDDSDMSRGWLD